MEGKTNNTCTISIYQLKWNVCLPLKIQIFLQINVIKGYWFKCITVFFRVMEAVHDRQGRNAKEITVQKGELLQVRTSQHNKVNKKDTM